MYNFTRVFFYIMYKYKIDYIQMVFECLIYTKYYDPKLLFSITMQHIIRFRK